MPRRRPKKNHFRDHSFRVDRGSGVWTIPFSRYEKEETVGVFICHQHEGADEDDVCVGSVLFDVPANAGDKAKGRPVWTLVSMEPLTLQPSILQRGGPDMVECLHGYITEGFWVSC